ncbi:hypothetical protein SAMN05443287_104103 [Micromonospora phaseoli]|uniref:Uncharacterized protein n=1 Tax=Micromonospora phaseoli TaxID=1144548 RepID=A0A1H6Y876_9ACTN|nr:hypothetical protein [Micromonospora phaseoli]PZW00076.1 hypothetical protein CLV64_103102 [Micromonospora phaseoli]GIJ79586.1 hypothetical protein Xph01_40180 [Micromonospora phaseoli]SEJ37469.1 hypothetical protein SAMN05443287_104103 [Micromonospora phaseoli]
MGDYTITIRAENAETETVICVDMDGSTPRVVELVMRAGSGISAPTLPSFDLNLLLRALFPDHATPVTPAAAERALGSSTEEPPSEQPRSSATGKRSVRTGANRTAAGAARRRTEASVPKGRVYRRMPDDVVDVFNRTGTVTAVAEHYGVPRHTAQGWIGRLRRRGGFSAAS